MTRALLLGAALAACADPVGPPTGSGHSSTIVLSPFGNRLYIVNPDADSVSVIDADSRTLVAEVGLGTPVLDAATGAYTPSVMPRALAVAPDGATVYVTGQRASSLFAISVATLEVRSIVVGSEPIGVVVSADGRDVYVACAQNATLVRVAAESLTVSGRTAVASEPWALAWDPAGTSILVSHLLAPMISVVDPAALVVRTTWTVPASAPRDDRRLAHGEPRGLYDLAVRPGSSEVWIPHLLLGTDTAQPDLDFESTVFPALSILRDDGTFRSTLTTDAADVPGIDGSFGDVVSGPHALVFTSDGAYALVVDTSSEDLLVVDAAGEVEATLQRPLPGHMPEGIVLSADESFAYVDERNTSDVAIVRLDRSHGGLEPSIADPVIVRLAADPMPAALRLGQHLFASANSDEYPITRNHWVACASCHIEGRSDAVTWRFEQGPRDTPSNAGGMLGTGFLFRTADRTRVQDYWHTINIEQGGRFDPIAQAALLDPLAAFVNFGLPLPIAPTTDPQLVARGRTLFEDPTVGCAGCHAGPRFTDSGAGNPTLDLGGVITLHDVGTCVTTDFPDVAHTDLAGHVREACRFDTPSLAGIASSPPYLHDGRAATIHDVLELTRGRMGDITHLSTDDQAALEEYVRSL